MLFTLYKLRIKNIIKLIQYVYFNANILKINKFKALVILYTVYKKNVLLNFKTFFFL